MQPFSSQTELCLLRAVIVCVCLLLLLLALLDDDNLANELLDWQRDWAKSQRHCVLYWLTKRPAEPQANIATKTKTTIWAARAFSAFSSWEYLCFLFYFTLSRRWTAQNFEQQKKREHFMKICLRLSGQLLRKKKRLELTELNWTVLNTCAYLRKWVQSKPKACQLTQTFVSVSVFVSAVIFVSVSQCQYVSLGRCQFIFEYFACLLCISSTSSSNREGRAGACTFIN